MKNLKVSMKLIVSFLIVAVFTTLVGVVGITGMTNINAAMGEMYDLQTVPIPDLAKVAEMLQRQRACMREFIIGAAVDDFDLIEDAKDRADEYKGEMYVHLDAYRKTIRSDEALALFDEGVKLFDTDFTECMDLMYELSKSDEDPADLYQIMREYTPSVNKIVENFDRCMEMKVETAADADESSTALANTMLALIIGVLVLAIAVAVFFALYISGLISKPLGVLAAFMKKAGTTGDISLSAADAENIRKFSEAKDEIGETIGSAAAFVGRVTEISNELTLIAEGDLTHKVSLLSEKDVMGNSIKKMLENLNDMFTEIHVSAEQVAGGSKQVSDGAQALAQGSTEQAASVEQLSSSIAEISEKTRSNSALADQASTLAAQIKGNAEKGSRQMDEMMTAVNDINEASQSISKVIKTIDDIAFQTNILALNAAVEAARAGQHGKGFAVVAEEVRSLAAKSADAAKDTGELIENSIEKATQGVHIAGETSASLSEIVEGINQSSQLIGEIAHSSEEQSQGISQINTGIDQVSHVVQQNSATAQQSAAASEQMSAQSDMLQQLISRFKINESSNGLPSRMSPPPRQLETPKDSETSDLHDDDSFGKY